MGSNNLSLQALAFGSWVAPTSAHLSEAAVALHSRGGNSKKKTNLVKTGYGSNNIDSKEIICSRHESGTKEIYSRGNCT